MGKENEFKFHSATVDTKEDIQAGFDLDSGNWQAVQNITQYKDCLLYTSPSPRDRQKSRMPSSA